MTYNEFHGEFIEGICLDNVLRNYFPDYNYKGVFLDVGAFEPIKISNSYHFEKNGWEVYCFEANTNSIPLLKEHRKNVYNYAIYDENKDEVEFNIVESGPDNWTAGFSSVELDENISKTFPCDNKKITIWIVYIYSLLFILSSLTMLYNYIINYQLSGDEYTFSRWLMGIAESPLVAFFVISASALSSKFNIEKKLY